MTDAGRSGRDRPALTERERAVLALMAEGRSNQAIGDRLSMARKTVEAHIANIFSKLELIPAGDDQLRGFERPMELYAVEPEPQ